ncbi:cytochrome P450 3A5-like, partial [Haliotis rubra]|uniref:cytochrome P450 3A5-like n=1 Tax=Haliotis rubra TaxID=36100 RepID=UPI001EE6340B
YGKTRNRLFKDAGIPGPEPVIYIGNFHQFVLKNVDLDNYPVDKSLLLERGTNWKRIRNIVTPTFSGSKLSLILDRIDQCACILTDNFAKAAESNQSIDVKRYFGAFTMDAISSTTFRIEVDSQSDFKNAFVEEAKKFFGEGIQNPLVMIVMIFPALTPLFRALGASTFSRTTLRFFSKVLNEMIEQRKADLKEGKMKRQDFFQLLMDAEDDGTDTQGGSQKKKMTNDEIIGQAMLFFIAGYETMANTLHFGAYSLAKNPDVQKRLTEEIDSVLGDVCNF